jgi:signal transduction histidine kinase
MVIPMLAAGWLASAWVSRSFEDRLEQWITDAARANQNWLQAYQNDALMLGRVLADDPNYLASLDHLAHDSIPSPIKRITQELGIHLVQIYTPQKQLIYSSIPVEVPSLWDEGQREAVLKVVRKNRSELAAVGITPLPNSDKPRYYLVLGSLIGEEFTKELAQLTGLKSRLYYREGRNYFDLLSTPGEVFTLQHLSKDVLRSLEVEQKTYYSVEAERGEFRGLYMPVIDSTGHVEAILFSGLERRGFQDVLTNRIALFSLISLVGILIALLTGVLLSRLVVRPLEYLRKGVLELAGQNFNATVPIRSDDELGDLAKAFNAMGARLREARDDQVQRFQSDKLAAMGELSAALAHEIRNPIGVINTSAALLQKADHDPAKTAELTRMIREESLRVSNLVQDFLQLSRYRKPVFAIIDPMVPLENALSLALAGREGVRIERRAEHNGARINADAGLLQQAWGNIFTNALQAMDGRSPEFTLATRMENGDVLLAVEDNGPGIPAEIMPRLFEPFFTTKEQGTGLGLTIAFTLVGANGGRLEACPPERSGARFVMRFPVYEQVSV